METENPFCSQISTFSYLKEQTGTGTPCEGHSQDLRLDFPSTTRQNYWMFPKVFSTWVAERSHTQKMLQQAGPEHGLPHLSCSLQLPKYSGANYTLRLLWESQPQNQMLQKCLSMLIPAIPSENLPTSCTSLAQTHHSSRPGERAPSCSFASQNIYSTPTCPAPGKGKQGPTSPQVDKILSEQSSAAAEPLIGSLTDCPFLGTRFFLLQAEARGQTLVFHPDFPSPPS